MGDDEIDPQVMSEVLGMPVKSAKRVTIQSHRDLWIDGVKMTSGDRIEVELAPLTDEVRAKLALIRRDPGPLWVLVDGKGYQPRKINDDGTLSLMPRRWRAHRWLLKQWDRWVLRRVRKVGGWVT